MNLLEIKNTTEYLIIKSFYGDRTAKRSQVPLMNHIDEGLEILDAIGATDLAKKAYCLHPIVQNMENVDVSDSEAYSLAVEYRNKANSYLCRPETDDIRMVELVKMRVGNMSRDCRDMLYADKLQNQKDFLIHHKDHARFEFLDRYFKLWLEYLSTDQVAFLDGWFPIESAPENVGVNVGWWEGGNFHHAIAYNSGGTWVIARTDGKQTCNPKYWNRLQTPPKKAGARHDY